jgi:hypothetical protein
LRRSNPESQKQELDCFVAEFIIGPAKGRTRWLLAMREKQGDCMKQPCVYIMANRRNGTLYTGVTTNLPKRAFEQREGAVKGFSKKYNCKMLGLV